MEPDITTADTQEIPKSILVAQDVLLHINTLLLSRGTYLSGYPAAKDLKDGDLQDNVDVIGKDCSVCALGALLLSKARLFNDVPMSYITSSDWNSGYPEVRRVNILRDEVVVKLADIFDDDQLDMIEAAFERRHIVAGASPRFAGYDDRIGDSISFGNDCFSNVERLKKIMENVIENNGVFNPPPRSADGNPCTAIPDCTTPERDT